MSETEKILSDFEQEISKSNQKDMLRILHKKYKEMESFTCLASPETVKEHNEILGNIRESITELKTLVKSHLKSDEKTQELIEKLFERAETNSSRITTLETVQRVVVGIFGVFIVAWTAGKLIFK